MTKLKRGLFRGTSAWAFVRTSSNPLFPYVPSLFTHVWQYVGDYCPTTELHSAPRFSWLHFNVASNDFPTDFDPMPLNYMAGVAFYPSLVLLMTVIFFIVTFFYTFCCGRCNGRGKEEKVDKVRARFLCR